jgi:hypothetical protein
MCQRTATRSPLTIQGQASLNRLKGRAGTLESVSKQKPDTNQPSVLEEALGDYEVNLKALEDREQGD